MSHPMRVPTPAAFLCWSLLLLLLHPTPDILLASASSAADDRNDGGTTARHEERAHLTPTSYGKGLFGFGGLFDRPSAGNTRTSLRRRQPGKKTKHNTKNNAKKNNAGKKNAGKNKNKGKKKNSKPNKNKPNPPPPSDGGGGGMRNPKPKVKPKPQSKPPNKNNNNNAAKDTNKPGGSKNNINNSNNKPKPTTEGGSRGSSSTSLETLSRLSSISRSIDSELFLYEHPSEGWIPSTIYKHAGLSKGLSIMNSQGVAGMKFYLGEPGDGIDKGVKYGLVNVAAFLAQSMKETIKYNACSENNWDLVGGGYPVSNACGQLGQSYQDYKCPKGEEHMKCDVDKNMEITASTHAVWYGAPGAFYCEPKKNSNKGFTGVWDYLYECNQPWANPPLQCTEYPGQKAGRFDHSKPAANVAGRTDVEGCCWWGRGVIQTTGICNFGKLNYYLGKRAADRGQKTPYGEVDFCKDPEAICSNSKFPELKWIAGMFYWIESVQEYDVRGWRYMDELRKLVDGDFLNTRGFIDAVSGIVNRGCHDPPCGTGAVDGGMERYINFIKALKIFGLVN